MSEKPKANSRAARPAAKQGPPASKRLTKSATSFEQGTVIASRYFLELSGEETAAALGIPEGTVKSRLSRALGRLRARVEEAPVA